eukprot:UN02657
MTNNTSLLCITLAIFLAMFCMVTHAEWNHGFDVTMLPGKAQLNKYTQVGLVFSPLDIAAPNATIKYLRVDYMDGAFVGDIKNCYAEVDGTKYTNLLNFHAKRMGMNYTVGFEIDTVNAPNVLNIQKDAKPTTFFCDVKFTAYPDCPHHPGGCFSVDLSDWAWWTAEDDHEHHHNSKQLTHHGPHMGYTPYEPAHDFDYMQCLPYDKDEPENESHRSIFAAIFDYKSTCYF